MTVTETGLVERARLTDEDYDNTLVDGVHILEHPFLTNEDIAELQLAKALWAMVGEMFEFANAPDDFDGVVRTNREAKHIIFIYASQKQAELEAAGLERPK